MALLIRRSSVRARRGPLTQFCCSRMDLSHVGFLGFDEGLTMVIGANLAAIIYEIGVVDGVSAAVIVHEMSTREVSEVMRMPRTIKDILEHADELAKRFEDYEPSATDERDPAVFGPAPVSWTRVMRLFESPRSGVSIA